MKVRSGCEVHWEDLETRKIWEKVEQLSMHESTDFPKMSLSKVAKLKESKEWLISQSPSLLSRLVHYNNAQVITPCLPE